MIQKLAHPAIPLLMALVLIPAVAITLTVSTAHANHGDEGNSGYFWDRSTASGHKNLLICDRPPNDDRCKIPFEIHSNVANIGLSPYTVKSESNRAVNTINSVTDYIGVKQVRSSDNKIEGRSLWMSYTAIYDIDRHCTAWLGLCIGDHGKDKHIKDFEIFLNTNRNAAVFGTVEQCNSKKTLVTVYDVERTILHELWHIMGTEHSGLSTSVVAYNGNSCGQASTPDVHDREVLKAKYPREER